MIYRWAEGGSCRYGINYRVDNGDVEIAVLIPLPVISSKQYDDFETRKRKKGIRVLRMGVYLRKRSHELLNRCPELFPHVYDIGFSFKPIGKQTEVNHSNL
jgi:hypothetical protein